MKLLKVEWQNVSLIRLQHDKIFDFNTMKYLQAIYTERFDYIHLHIYF